MRLVRKADGAVVADDLQVADSFLTRLRGLMGRGSLRPGEALWIEGCDSTPHAHRVVSTAAFENRCGRGTQARHVVRIDLCGQFELADVDHPRYRIADRDILSDARET